MFGFLLFLFNNWNFGKIKWLKTGIDPDTSKDDLDIPEEELVANRFNRNARTHKNRLSGLPEFKEN